MRLRDTIRDLPARFIAVGDEWFGYDRSVHAREDIVHVFQCPFPIEGVQNHEFITMKLDLCEAQDSLWEKIKKSTRQKIRGAEAEDVAHHFERHASRASIAQFARDYEGLAARKSLEMLNLRRLDRLSLEGALPLSFTTDAVGRTLTWHVYVLRRDRVRLLHSVSNLNDADRARRSFVGRANCLHHWKDIQRFRDDGIRIYDLGGYYTGSVDAAQIQIAQFKSNFGGELETSYNATIVVTAKGWLSMWVRGLIRRVRGSPS
jgi:hypothetical protein